MEKKDLHGNGLLNQFSTSIKQQKWNVNFVMAQYLDIWKKVRHKDKGTLYRGLCTVTSTFTDSHLDWRMSCLCYWIRHPEENKCVSFWFFRERGGFGREVVYLEYFSLIFDRNRVFPIYSTLLEWMFRFSVGWYLKLLDIPNFTGSSYSMRKRTAPKQWDRLNMAETGGTRRDVSTGSTPQRPVPMKLFATWEVERTSPNCVPRWVLLKTIFFCIGTFAITWR